MTTNTVSNSMRVSFWNLLQNNSFTICIPKIQRNYAQGRLEPEPTQIRENFLDEILLSLAIKENLDGEDILRKLNLSNNCIQIRGMKKPLNFQNSSDLRKIFLFCGEVIIIYSDELEETYDYYAQDYADFDMILAILKNIRICCMEYGENTNVEISIK